MSSLSRRIRQAGEFGISLSLIAILVLTGCGGGSGSTASAPVSTTDLMVTPMKGQFSEGANVRVKLASDLSVVASGVVGSNGTAVVKMPTGKTGPFLIEAGQAGDSYFDESTAASAVVPANTVALRALIPDAAASAVGVTALTEMAVGQIEAASGVAGIKAAKATDVIAANATIGSQFGVADPLTPPTVIGSATGSTGKIAGGTTADDYALKLAGIAKLAKPGNTALEAIQDLSKDIADGKLDGLIKGVPVSKLAITVASGTSMTLADMNAAITAQVQAATAQYAASGAAAPTVTLTVQDLSALLNAAIKVGEQSQSAAFGTTLTTTQLNEQIAATVQTEVKTMAQTVATQLAAGGTTEAAALLVAQITAVNNAIAQGSALVNIKATANTYFATLQAGLYYFDIRTSNGNLDSGNIDKTVYSFNGATYNRSGSGYVYKNAAWLPSVSLTAGEQWTLTPTSPGGWVDAATADSTFKITVEADGTLTMTDTATNDAVSSLVIETKLDDGRVLKNDCPLGLASPTCTRFYPTGSRGYTLKDTYLNDRYDLTANNVVKDMRGVALTALPNVGDNFCVEYSDKGTVINGTAYTASAGGYRIAAVAGCNVAALAAPGNVSNLTVTISARNTGNAAAPTVLIALQRGCTQSCDTVIGLVPGKGVFTGGWNPKGVAPYNNSVMTDYNKIAYDAVVSASKSTGISGLTSLPAL